MHSGMSQHRGLEQFLSDCKSVQPTEQILNQNDYGPATSYFIYYLHKRPMPAGVAGSPTATATTATAATAVDIDRYR